MLRRIGIRCVHLHVFTKCLAILDCCQCHLHVINSTLYMYMHTWQLALKLTYKKHHVLDISSKYMFSHLVYLKFQYIDLLTTPGNLIAIIAHNSLTHQAYFYRKDLKLCQTHYIFEYVHN